jgi:hypothetical protein
MVSGGTTYAFLPRASANRVFAGQVPDLLAAELTVLDRGLAVPRRARTSTTTIGGVSYVVAELDDEPYGPDDLAVLSNLSTMHALFSVEGELLRPQPVHPVQRHDDDLVTIQRYAGKTNEVFTHLLVNLALAASSGGFGRLLGDEPLRLLDPVCGRGTTLNRAVLYGIDAIGIDLDQRDVEAYEAFFIAWCKDKRLKHVVERAKLKKGRTAPATRCAVTFGSGKDAGRHRSVQIINDDTARAGEHVKRRSIDLLVCDLPYGVQHGARPAGGQLDRGPGELLRVVLPDWVELLRPGAGVAMAWNRRTLARGELVDLVVGAGLEPAPVDDGDTFVHRVDRSITRDVLVARRPVG